MQTHPTRASDVYHAKFQSRLVYLASSIWHFKRQSIKSYMQKNMFTHILVTFYAQGKNLEKASSIYIRC